MFRRQSNSQLCFAQKCSSMLFFAEVGKANGLSMLLDAETFDYTYHLKAGQGFKLSVHHHLDQPIMSIKGGEGGLALPLSKLPYSPTGWPGRIQRRKWREKKQRMLRFISGVESLWSMSVAMHLKQLSGWSCWCT